MLPFILGGMALGLISANAQHKQKVKQAEAMAQNAKSRFAMNEQINLANKKLLGSNLQAMQEEYQSKFLQSVGTMEVMNAEGITGGNSKRRKRAIVNTKGMIGMSKMRSQAQTKGIEIAQKELGQLTDAKAIISQAKNSVGNYWTDMLGGAISGASVGASIGSAMNSGSKGKNNTTTKTN